MGNSFLQVCKEDEHLGRYIQLIIPFVFLRLPNQYVPIVLFLTFSCLYLYFLCQIFSFAKNRERGVRKREALESVCFFCSHFKNFHNEFHIISLRFDVSYFIFSDMCSYIVCLLSFGITCL